MNPFAYALAAYAITAAISLAAVAVVVAVSAVVAKTDQRNGDG